MRAQPRAYQIARAQRQHPGRYGLPTSQPVTALPTGPIPGAPLSNLPRQLPASILGQQGALGNLPMQIPHPFLPQGPNLPNTNQPNFNSAITPQLIQALAGGIGGSRPMTMQPPQYQAPAVQNMAPQAVQQGAQQLMNKNMGAVAAAPSSFPMFGRR